MSFHDHRRDTCSVVSEKHSYTRPNIVRCASDEEVRFPGLPNGPSEEPVRRSSSGKPFSREGTCRLRSLVKLRGRMRRQFTASQVCLFGSQDRFAVECELFPPEVYNYHHAPFGVLYLWAAGHRLGRENEDCDLSVPGGTLLTQWRRRGTVRDP